MSDRIDLQALAERESEQVEWKEAVADEQDVVKTLVAFANDRANLGGGYVVCGARESRDGEGFARVELVGMGSADCKRVEGKVLAICRDQVSPPLAPRVEELRTEDPARRILVFVMPQTGRAHQLRLRNGETHHYIRVARTTQQARNGLLLDLLTLRGEREPWDRRPCGSASIADLDLVALRDTLQRLGRFDPQAGIEPHLSDEQTIHALVPSLCVREPLSGELRPRNFAILLFGREIQRFIPGACTYFSLYPGPDRSEPHAERHELAGTLLEQARRVLELLDVQAYTAFDKTDRAMPNAVRYPLRALQEAAVNALVHRSYEEAEPTRITAFSDRIEVMSPGPLPLGVDPVAWREGRAGARWRNQSLAWLLNRLQIAQGEGQGIPTIVRTMREEGCPPPTFEANEGQVLCTLPAHPRHALARSHRAVETALSLGDFEHARGLLEPLVARDPLGFRTALLFAEVHRVLRDPAPVRRFVDEHRDHLPALPASALLALAEALLASPQPLRSDEERASELYQLAAAGHHELLDARRVAVGLKRYDRPARALEFIRTQLQRHPEWADDAGLIQIQGDALIGQAKRCSETGNNRSLPPATRRRAWEDCRRYLNQAEPLLRRAQALRPDAGLLSQIERNLAFLSLLRKKATR
ncbi:MAG: putative DNA binding domain-containing protein [Myxococcales bacterium]|nr:putative DNA binding domain-containing protein [Myxococcales bacterium]